MNNISTLLEGSRQAIRYWWLLLIVGLALFAAGVIVFVYPRESYIELSMLFGWLILFTGIFEVLLASANKHFVTGRGWMLVGGIIEIALGIILIINIRLSA